MKKLLGVIMVVAFVMMATMAMGYPKICIDPGHGGTDPGAVGYVTEKTINLDASLKLKAWLNLDTSDAGGGYAWDVIMTRSTDATVSLEGRVNYANSNGASRFFCIHSNSATPAAYGSETFCYTSGSSYSFDLRNKTQSELISHGGLYNRGNKTADFYVLKYTSMPSILTEMGFVSNSGDAASLGNATWRNEVAKGFLHALQTHYGYTSYTPVSNVTIIVDNGTSGYSASANWWNGTSTAGYYGSNYQARATEGVSDPATWTANIPSAGSWKVYAWWTAGSNRPTSAPYMVSHSGGSTTVNVNQQANGGAWNLLGTFSLNAGSNQVKLSCWTTAGYYVIADAIKWYK